MAVKIRGMINNHLYPSFYFKYPILIRLHHFLTYATTLRNWYIKPVLSRIIRNAGNNFVLYDAGCGAGDFILPLLKKHKNSLFIGADKLPGNINLCNAYLHNYKLVNGRFILKDIENYVLPEKADVAICVTVLQYCTDDKMVLRNIYNSLKPGGTLLLYVPVNYNRIFGLTNKLTKILEGYSYDYDKNRGIKKHYSPDEIREIVALSGFSITSEITAYKRPGKISFELFSGFLNLIKSMPWFLSIFVLLLLLLCYPVILLFMAIDMFDRGKEGNGILIIACRNL